MSAGSRGADGADGANDKTIPERSRHLEIHKKTRFLQHSILKVSEFRGNCEGNKREHIRGNPHVLHPVDSTCIIYLHDDYTYMYIC